ncbi:MAG: twin-arginine translocase subunit TatC [Antricoccus sp.]
MTLIEHLRELRSRLFKAFFFIIIGAIVGWFWYTHGLLSFLERPYCALPAKMRFSHNNTCELLFLNPADGLLLRLKISLMAGIIVSSPFWLYQLWAFITPGLRKNERRWAISFVASSSTLFALGIFSAYLTLEAGLRVLIGLAGPDVVAALTAPEYLDFVLMILLVFGISFELPLVVVMTNLAGVLKYELLKRSRRWLIFLTFVFAAVITPSQDPFSMLAMALPMTLLFEGAIQFARVHDKRLAKRQAAQSFDHIDDDQPSPLDPTDL